MDELPFLVAPWDPVSTGPARVAKQPYQCSAVALLLSQPLLPTLGIILFSLFSSPEEEGGIISYPKERSIIPKGHSLQGSSVSKFHCINSLQAFLSSFPTCCPVLFVVVNFVADAQVGKSFMALGLLTFIPDEVWDSTTVMPSGALTNSCFLFHFERMQLQPQNHATSQQYGRTGTTLRA